MFQWKSYKIFSIYSTSIFKAGKYTLFKDLFISKYEHTTTDTKIYTNLFVALDVHIKCQLEEV